MVNRRKNAKEIEAKIIARAWKDSRFKEKLMKNPREAFKEMGLDIPADVQIKVQEDKPNSFTFVLPSAAAETREMSDQQLEKLAAGCGYMSFLAYSDACRSVIC